MNGKYYFRRGTEGCYNRRDNYSKCQLERGHNLQISLGKTRNTATCTHGLMTSHAAAKDHMTPYGAWLDCTTKLLAKFARNDCETLIANLR